MQSMIAVDIRIVKYFFFELKVAFIFESVHPRVPSYKLDTTSLGGQARHFTVRISRVTHDRSIESILMAYYVRHTMIFKVL